ncbi:uncharacterized protein THITE_2107958 [Thermothielavioides terrestris NRRL 8126]|uniref:Uncharacterized protein n=1 Tax=Thermothielavioides terrestris (strain ATCC 38088 / NRRL 8126) TaxID=578455 RepID=G2QWT0_THETT|nr:uncharacterized protein THITE_2107958 [Thermothielavioides terrestris NRRL 8126]AEO63094.1 hypothetical protein THITE_2107958 [Thermothielavioides terrestris NRRL 8126]
MALQPNFAAIAATLEELAQQYRLFANLQAADLGVRLTQVPDALNNQITTLQQNVIALRVNMQRIEHMLKTRDFNATACIINSTVTRQDHPLLPLRDIRTGQEIPHFSATVSAIAGMQGDTLDPILEALGLPTTGTVAEKRRRLMSAIGVGTHCGAAGRQAKEP